MDEQRKNSGRTRIYNGEQDEHLREMQRRRRSASSGQLAAGSTKRRREQENEQKIQLLSIILGVLVVLLVAAIIYEVVLGHGTKATGNERMAQQARTEQSEIVIQNETQQPETD